jgi:hypothetical protein
MNKVNHRKEFLRVSLKEIRDEIEKQGLSKNWTMTAHAREYFESQTIEAMINDDPAKRDAWIRWQRNLLVRWIWPTSSGQQDARHHFPSDLPTHASMPIFLS